MSSKEKEKKLTAKQELFCYEYCIDFNATRAAIVAGYSKESAKVIGYENLTKPYIQKRIKHMKDNLAETAGISAMMVLNEYRKIAFSSIAHLHNTWVELKDFNALTDDQKACVKSIQTKKQKIGDTDIEMEFVKIELHSKEAALKGIREMCGFDAPEKMELDMKPIQDIIIQKNYQ
jgi:phage terminase small subunit